jgi:hypothetical protein
MSLNSNSQKSTRHPDKSAVRGQDVQSARQAPAGRPIDAVLRLTEEEETQRKDRSERNSGHKGVGAKSEGAGRTVDLASEQGKLNPATIK